MPHKTIDPIVVSSHIVTALQSIVSRRADPLHSLVVSVTTFHGGDAHNVIPETVKLSGTLRALRQEMRELGRERLIAIVEGVAKTMGASATVNYMEGYPVTMNDEGQTAFAVDIARRVAGDKAVEDNTLPVMGGEDFSFMLNARPGAFIFMGNGVGPALHHPGYNFNDEAIPVGCSYWVRLVERALPLS